MRKIVLVLLLSISFQGFGQTKSSDRGIIKRSIIDFLKAYKINEADIVAIRSYSLTKGGYPDTTQIMIDFNGVEKYLADINQKDLLSVSYLDELRRNFYKINEDLKLRPPMNELIGIPGLNLDIILSSFEPREILDHLDEGKFDKINIIYNKALVRFRISKEVKLLFTLTKLNNKWQIDHIGYDNSYKYSIGNQ